MAAVLCRPSMNQKPLQYFSLSVIKHFWLSFSWQKVSVGKGFYLVYSWTGQFKVELILGWEAHAYCSIVVAQTRNFPVMIDFLNTQELGIFYCFSWLQYYRCQLDFCNSCSVVYAVKRHALSAELSEIVQTQNFYVIIQVLCCIYFLINKGERYLKHSTSSSFFNFLVDWSSIEAKLISVTSSKHYLIYWSCMMAALFELITRTIQTLQ